MPSRTVRRPRRRWSRRCCGPRGCLRSSARTGLHAVPRLVDGGVRGGLEVDLELPRSTGVKNSVWSEAERRRPRRRTPAREGEHRLPVIQGPGDHRPVPVGRPVEPVVEPVQDPGDEMPLPLPLDVRVDPARGEHRVQGEGDEEGDQDGEGDGDPELEEEAADDPLHEGHRDEDGDDREGGGQHREPDLARSLPRAAVEVVLPALQVADDVLPDDDGVVDQQADGQGQGHQGHHVERHAQEVHDDEGGDDRDRQGQAGDDRGAPGVEEAEDDEDRQDPAEDQGLLDVLARIPGS